MLIIAWVEAGADPGDGRHDGAGRAGRVGAATTAAQIPINCTVTPIVAAFWIARIICNFLTAHARYREKREGCRTGQHRSNTGNYASP